jgi:hypothetical protein|tara:strand:+ start:66 stop:383 length:318 start_codon:yes stop_codon:yes gene_type:complete
MNRKQRRAAKKNKDSEAVAIEEKVALFDKLPDECMTCQLSFDKKDKEQVSTWNVVVREDEGVVRLYCPDCWDKAQDIINSFIEYKEQQLKAQKENENEDDTEPML